MNLILIRHGETKEGKQGILLGHLPGTLTAKGKKEIEIISNKIKEKKLSPGIIISSDLKRAKQSAEILSKSLGIKVKYDNLLKERGGGIAEGKKEDEINWNLYEKMALPYRKHVGGESFTDVKKRVKLFLKDISKNKFKNIIIVSHNVFLTMLLSYIKKWNIKDSLHFDFKGNFFILNIKTKRVEKVPLS